MMKYILWDGTVFWTDEPLNCREEILVKRRLLRHFIDNDEGFDKVSRVDVPAYLNRNGIVIWRRNGEAPRKDYGGPFLWASGRRFIPMGIDPIGIET